MFKPFFLGLSALLFLHVAAQAANPCAGTAPYVFSRVERGTGASRELVISWVYLGPRECRVRYNVSWQPVYGKRKQVALEANGVEDWSRHSTTFPIQQGYPYDYGVQGCRPGGFLQTSDCSNWESGRYRPFTDVCVIGYVWREAFAGDRTCVSSAARDQARLDNQQAAARRQAGGGPYGPDSCKAGYVWREASPADRVCVTPKTRDDVRYDNKVAALRKA